MGMISIPRSMSIHLVSMPTAITVPDSRWCIVPITSIPLKVPGKSARRPVSMISTVTHGMSMRRSFRDDKRMLFFAQLVSGFVYGSAVGCSSPNQTTPHGEGYPGRSWPVVCGILPVCGNIDTIDGKRAGLNLGHGLLVHVSVGNLAPVAIAVQDRVQFPRGW